MQVTKFIKKILIIPLLVAGCATPSVNPADFQEAADKLSCSSPAEFLVTFIALWSAQTHPNGIPEDPHFSPLIGGTHNMAVQFWAPGATASPGMENMAENGRVSPLDSEIQTAMENGNAGVIIRGSGIGPSPGETSIDFNITEEFRYVTLVSMIAPSPDWFVGVHDLDLCGEDGNWMNHLMVELFPYDAGTDSGVTFTSADADTLPQEPIRLLNEDPFLVNGDFPPMGIFSFTRVEGASI
ncbi:MAG: spondin domain-containing protein [bacterium]|nr:spondin domain-containing protein [bacterium]